MAKFLSLVKVQFLSYLGINKLLYSKKKKQIAGIGGMVFAALIFVALVGGLGYFYAGFFAQTLHSYGKINQLIPSMLAIAALLGFMFTFYSVGSSIFGFKDYDMLMSMPLKPTAIVLAKYVFLYVADLVFSILLLVPTLIVYVNTVGAMDALLIVYSCIACVFSPLLPVAISTVIGMLVYYISSKFRRKNVIQIILLVLMFVGIFALSFLSGFVENGDTTMIMNVTGTLGKIYFIFPWLVNALESPLWLLAFIGVNLIPAILVITFVCAFYKKLNTVFTAKRTKRNYKIKEYKTKGVNKALLNKEFKRLFSCPVYAVNALMGVFMLLVLSIAYAVLCNTIKTSTPEIFYLFEIFNRFMPTLLVFSLLMAPTTSASISLEGQAFWILKTAPVSFNKIAFSKLNVNTILYTSAGIIGSVIIACCSGMTAVNGILLALISILVSQFGGVLGLISNLRFAKLKWKTENEAVKQGAPVFITTFTSLIISAITGVTAYYAPISIAALFGIFVGVFLILDIILFAVLFTKGEKLFNKISL